MKKEFYYMRENLWQSILADLFTFGCLLSSLFVNHYFLNARWYIDVYFLVISLLWNVARTQTKKFTSKQELIDFLTKEEV